MCSQYPLAPTGLLTAPSPPRPGRLDRSLHRSVLLGVVHVHTCHVRNARRDNNPNTRSGKGRSAFLLSFCLFLFSLPPLPFRYPPPSGASCCVRDASQRLAAFSFPHSPLPIAVQRSACLCACVEFKSGIDNHTHTHAHCWCFPLPLSFSFSCRVHRAAQICACASVKADERADAPTRPTWRRGKQRRWQRRWRRGWQRYERCRRGWRRWWRRLGPLRLPRGPLSALRHRLRLRAKQRRRRPALWCG